LHEVFVMRMSVFPALVSFGFASTGVLAQSVPPAISTDPPAAPAHPADMTVLHIPSQTDHSWSDHRIALESTVITWLAGLN
jgi:hypothetical protein